VNNYLPVLKRSLRTLLAVLSVGFLASCSWFNKGKDVPVYYGSVDIAPLEIPEGLDQPQFVNPLIVEPRDPNMPAPDQIELQPPRVASTAGQSDVNAWLSWSAEGVYLQVRDSSDSVIRRLGFAIERSGMNVRTQERGFFSKMAFWRDDEPNYSGVYQTAIRADGADTRIYLLQSDGAPAGNSAAEHILAVFMERLG
jgi:uncharacterized lipoprotein